MLNVVNFGGGAYVLYAEVLPTGEIEVDPEPYSDTFDRPARLLPIEARALLAAIELLGVHLSEHLVTVREKLERALGDIAKEGLLVSNARTDDAIARQVGEAIEARRLIELEYYAENEDRVLDPRRGAVRADQRARGLVRARLRPGEGRRCATSGSTGSSASTCSTRPTSRAPTSTRSPTSRAGRAPARSRARASRTSGSRPSTRAGSREERTVLAELDDGAMIVEWAFKGERYLVKEILKEAGDAAVLEPRRRARGRARRRRAASGTLLAVSRRDQIVMSDDEADAFLRDGRTVTCATIGRDGWPHLMPLWYVIRDRRAVGVDVRQVAEGRQPAARPALHAAGRGRHGVRAAARRDARLRGGRARASSTWSRRSAPRSPRATAAPTWTPELEAAMRAQAAKRVGLQFVERRRVTWDHRKLGGTY